jgi:ubiquinone/menaquinone biosynthesis C-methylase UbiE
MRMLHFAPEGLLRERFKAAFAYYETADIDMPDVNHRVDLQKLPFSDGVYDIVYASHVLEHVPDDLAAIAEIRRILAPGGIAILPVPIVCESTVEYRKPNASESMHVRAPGLDYFDRYRRVFKRVETYTSTDFPATYQLHIVESRRNYPRRDSPQRTPMEGDRHIDVVPVCYTA